MKSCKCFYALISALLVLIVSFAPQSATAKKNGRIGLQTLYKELRNRSAAEVEWYVRHAYYVAEAENANLFNVKGRENDNCVSSGLHSSFADLEKIYSAWSQLSTCSSSVTSLIWSCTDGGGADDADEEIIYRSPAELFCRCMHPSISTYPGSYHYPGPRTDNDQTRKFYFDKVPGSTWPEAMNGLYANLTSTTLAEFLILEALSRFNETGLYHDRDGYVLFQIVRGLRREDVRDNNPYFQETPQSIFQIALTDSANDLIQAIAIRREEVSQQNQLASSIIPWVKNWIQDNMVRRFENHPTYKYQFMGRRKHFDEAIN